MKVVPDTKVAGSGVAAGEGSATTALADQALQTLLEQQLARARTLGPQHTRLWEHLIAATQGGKRFRPLLLITTHRCLGGTDQDAVALLGAAVELMHTAFVLHDDVIDGDHVRRGRLNLPGTFAQQARQVGADTEKARRYGDSAGILAGDLALASTIRVVATCCSDPSVTRRLLDLFDRALHVTAAGEMSDVRFGLGLERASLAQALRMEERKTSVYSFELPMQAGAVLAGAAESLVDRLGEVGRLIGTAFQLLDDIQGVFGDEGVTGKSTLADLREGKQTPLIVHARRTAQWPQIAAIVGDPHLTHRQAETVRDLLTICGSRAFIEDLAGEYVDAAFARVDELGMPPDFAEVLFTLSRAFARSAV